MIDGWSRRWKIDCDRQGGTVHLKSKSKIKFWTTFVFFIKLIFPLLLELENFGKSYILTLNIFVQIFLKIFKAFRVLQILFHGQILLILTFQIFEPENLKKDHFSELVTYWTWIPLTQGLLCHMSCLWDISLPLFDFRCTDCGGVWWQTDRLTD